MADEDQILIGSMPANASRVDGGLWVGSAPPIGPFVRTKFDCLVLAAAEYQVGPECFHGAEVVAVPLNDDGSPMTAEERRDAAMAAGRVIGWLSGGKRVLVTCHMGLNRSGLVAALSMCCRPGGAGWEEAVEAVRAARGPRALRNPHFLSFLKEYSAVTRSKQAP
jgi:protein-tyrosine phosphatase